MKKPILFIHSAGPQGPHTGSGDLLSHLQNRLGRNYRVLHPTMPDPDNPHYERWKRKLETEIAKINGDVVLVGHSLGGSVLLKYLSEENSQKPIVGVCILAAPYWGDKGWRSRDFKLRKNLSKLHQIPHIVLFHSRDDEVVPFSHVTHYAENIPFATVHELDDLGHLFTEGCAELVSAIRWLAKNKRKKSSI